MVSIWVSNPWLASNGRFQHTVGVWYVYLLETNDKTWHYYGYSADLRRRYEEHISGKVAATKRHLPLNLRYYEAYDSDALARQRESTLKRSRSATKAIFERINNPKL